MLRSMGSDALPDVRATSHVIVDEVLTRAATASVGGAAAVGTRRPRTRVRRSTVGALAAVVVLATASMASANVLPASVNRAANQLVHSFERHITDPIARELHSNGIGRDATDETMKPSTPHQPSTEPGDRALTQTGASGDHASETGKSHRAQAPSKGAQPAAHRHRRPHRTHRPHRQHQAQSSATGTSHAATGSSASTGAGRTPHVTAPAPSQSHKAPSHGSSGSGGKQKSAPSR